MQGRALPCCALHRMCLRINARPPRSCPVLLPSLGQNMCGRQNSSCPAPCPAAQVLRSLDAQRVWHDAHAFARKVLAAARVQLRDGELLALGPGQLWRQACHAVLLHGELTLRPPARRAQHRVLHGPGWAPHKRTPNKPVASPAVLPFLAANLDSTLPVLGHIRGMGVASTACSYVGGGEGAILVLCPPSVESPTDSASESSTVKGGATRHGRGAQRECSGGGYAQGEPVLRPLGHPLRRTRSRRLPLSSALSGMESVQP